MNAHSLNRRDFLKTGAATAALAATASFPGSRGLFGAVDYGPKKIPFAIQLYTIGGAFGQDPEGAFDLLAKAGYKGVEFAGGYAKWGNDAPGLRKALDNAGLKAVGTHTSLNSMQGDALKATVEFHQTIGNTRIGVSSTNPGAALNPGAGGGRGAAAPVLIQGLTAAQIAPTGMADALTKANEAVTAARSAMNSSIFAATASTADIRAKVDQVAAAELVLANARADTIAKIQASANKLTPEQLAALANPAAGRGGRGGGGGGPAVLAKDTPSTATKAEWEAVADIFNSIQANLTPLGMHTYYHSHPPDFNTVNGVSTWEIFFARAVKDVYMQLDLGHVGTAGVDQVAMMKKFPGRANTVHVKPANGGGGKLVGDPTDGNLAKWPAIFAACEDPAVGNTAWYILEYDGGNMDQALRTADRLKEWGKI